MASLGKKDGALKAQENEYLVNLLKLSDTQTSEILTPRTVVHMLDETTTVSEALGVGVSRQFTRVPVYRDSTDNVTGMVIRVELFEALLDGRLNEFRPAVAMTVEGVIAKVSASERRSQSTSGGWLESFIDWLVPYEDVVWWRGAITAVVPLVVGVWLGSVVPADLEQWEGTEQAFFSGYYALDIGGIDND